jgi:hypothetical protein
MICKIQMPGFLERWEINSRGWVSGELLVVIFKPDPQVLLGRWNGSWLLPPCFPLPTCAPSTLRNQARHKGSTNIYWGEDVLSDLCGILSTRNAVQTDSENTEGKHVLQKVNDLRNPGSGWGRAQQTSFRATCREEVLSQIATYIIITLGFLPRLRKGCVNGLPVSWFGKALGDADKWHKPCLEWNVRTKTTLYPNPTLTTMKATPSSNCPEDVVSECTGLATTTTTKQPLWNTTLFISPRGEIPSPFLPSFCISLLHSHSLSQWQKKVHSDKRTSWTCFRTHI